MRTALYRRLKSLINFFTTKTYCPICHTNNVVFSPLPDFYRQNAEKYGYLYFGQGEMTALDTYNCSVCGASDRERLYAYWLDTEISTGRLPKQSTVMHFAPEHALSLCISEQNYFVDYQTADLSMSDVAHQVDLMQLPFDDNSLDFFICSHVLEHVSDDKVAMSELFRILKRGGRGLLMAPIIVGLPETIEDPLITSESERWRLFGQSDHVRLYSHNDYVQRITDSGFVLQQLDLEHFGPRVFKRLGLKPTSILYIVRKP